MIPAIDDMCRVYGAQARRKKEGGYAYMGVDPRTGDAEEKRHEDGWPDKSPQERWQSMQDAAGSGTFIVSQFPEESFTGDGRDVWREVQNAPERLRAILEVHYVMRGKVNAKFHLCAATRDRYYHNLDRLHQFLAARLLTHDVPHTVATL
jgi:hypothetical protein